MVLTAIWASWTKSSASFVALLFGSWASFTEANSSSASAARAATDRSALETFSSVSPSFFSTSAATRRRAARCSTVENSFLCLLTSVWASASRVWNLRSSELTSTNPSLPFASICRAATIFLASTSAAFTSFSRRTVCSLASLSSAVDSADNFSSSAQIVEASARLRESASARRTCSSASFSIPRLLRLPMPARSSARRRTAWSSCLWNSSSFSTASFPGALASRFTSKVFIWMNILTIEEACCAVAAAASDFLDAASVTSRATSPPSALASAVLSLSSSLRMASIRDPSFDEASAK
mmetsp:Transcript_19974/g.31872  ORF Transcript_19974/g.31872 Transcript_19974/m.31872 type:complete len:297 (-) Transcript_19974:16-906(-)